MNAAIIGMIGVFLGALMTQLGAFLTDRRQVRNEIIRWARDETAAAYDGALRHLLRAANRRSKMTVVGGTVTTILTDEGVMQMFDDLVEAQFWLHKLATRCGVAQRESVMHAVGILDISIDVFTQGRFKEVNTMTTVKRVIQIIIECARTDGGHAAAAITHGAT